MLKKILNVKNAETLTKETQSKINGGVLIYCNRKTDCPKGWLCSGAGFCYPTH